MTTVRGDAISDFCLRHAGMLNLDIYGMTESDLEPELASWLRTTRANWRKEWESQSDDGYHCAFYVPIGGADGTGQCPPVLVFRGSDSEASDFAELAAGMRLNLTYNIDMPRGTGQPDIVGTFNYDSTQSPSPELKGKTMAEMRAGSLTEEPLFVGETARLRRTLDGPMLFNVDIDVTATLDASLFYGANGDWAVNFSQGLGNFPPQYQSAIVDGKRAALDARTNWDGRLVIVGHSLGGGLASAAAISARGEVPDLVIRCNTYNAAGLHALTARKAGGTLSTASEVPVRAVHVKDEILNSMQAHSRMVPFLADLLAWGNKSMPAAVANPTAQTGKGFGEGPFAGVEYADKGTGDLPVLFTLDRQTLVAPGVTIMSEILALANRASTAREFVEDLVDFLVQQIFPNYEISWGEGNDLRTDGVPEVSVPPDLAALIEAAIFSGGPVPTIPVTGGAAWLRARINTLLSALVRDTITLARVMVASGEFHTFPPCAFTFLLDYRR